MKKVSWKEKFQVGDETKGEDYEVIVLQNKFVSVIDSCGKMCLEEHLLPECLSFREKVQSV